jgi:hypothetical protein
MIRAITSLGSFLSSLAAECFRLISNEAIPFQLGDQILVAYCRFVTTLSARREIFDVLDQFLKLIEGRITAVFSPASFVTY